MPEVPEDHWDGPWDLAPPWFPPAASAEWCDQPDLELLDLLDEVLAGLSVRSADVLRRRLGLSPEGAETLQEIGDSYGLSRERIRQLQEQAIRRTRSAAKREKKRGAQGPDEALAAQLRSAFRSLRNDKRGRYLQATFPEANAEVLARVLETWTPATSNQIVGWLRTSEELRRVEDQLSRQLLKADRRWERLARGVVWPVLPSLGGWFPVSPCRSVGSEGGERWSKKLGRTVQYESGLEERILSVLDDSREVVELCEQPVRIQYAWFGGPRIYVPDFAVRLADGRGVLVEVKPRVKWAEGANLAKWNAATRWCEQQGWGFLVCDDRGHPGTLVGAADEADYAILEALTAERPATWDQLRRYWFGAGHSWATLLATSLTYGFAFLRPPFEVRRARHSPWLDAIRRPAGPT